jgi:hypothetical protein
MVTNAHRVEVKVGVDGYASALPSMAATAGPPPGATAINVTVSNGASHLRITNTCWE